MKLPALSRHLAVQSVVSIADQGLVVLATFLCSAFIARSGGLDGLGLFASTFVIVVAFRSLQNAVILQPMSSLGPLQGLDDARYRGFLLIAHTTATALPSVVVILGAGVALWQGLLTRGAAAAIALACVYANVHCAQNILRRQCYVDHRPIVALVQSFGFALATALGGWVLMRRRELDAAAVYAALAGAGLLASGPFAVSWFRRAALPGRPALRNYTRAHWSQGRWVLLAMPFAVVSFQGYYLLGGWALSVADVGALKAADSLVAPFDQLLIGLTMFFVPYLARGSAERSGDDERKWIQKFLVAVCGLGLAYGAILWLAGGDLLVLVFGPDAVNARAVVPWIALVPLAKAAAYPAYTLLIARGATKQVFQSYLVSALATLSIGLLLATTSGVIGAAAGLVAANVTNAFALHWLRKRSLTTSNVAPEAMALPMEEPGAQA